MYTVNSMQIFCMNDPDFLAYIFFSIMQLEHSVWKTVSQNAMCSTWASISLGTTNYNLFYGSLFDLKGSWTAFFV